MSAGGAMPPTPWLTSDRLWSDRRLPVGPSLTAVPLAGWAYSSAAGFPIVLFGVLPLPDFVPVNRELSDALKPVHHWLAYGLAAVVTLHVAGALKHHFIDRDALLLRMWPGRG